MAKFNADEKLKAVLRYYESSESLKSIVRPWGSIYCLLNWIRQYEHHSEKTFRKSHTSYTAQDKLDVLQYRETAAIFNIASHSTILSWQKSLNHME
ncbi:hypothetical protein GCM10010917_30620 [Paenibacillus physcomitrellae]|uniref:Transposase n=1 Tax=Paenibacillus physcomitrellae TaxID=1619311 RepID=A0ABQ1GGG8_9BACL|nr:hypothetical protein GCM10010917_30620 [Paenibacillus physcomitrellae]